MKFGQGRRQKRLYKQWAKHSRLPPGALSRSEMSADVKIAAEVESRSYRFRVKIRDAVEKVLGLK